MMHSLSQNRILTILTHSFSYDLMLNTEHIVTHTFGHGLCFEYFFDNPLASLFSFEERNALERH